MSYVYILKSDNNRYYIGSTLDLKRRIKQHENGHTHTTQRLSNFKLVFSQKFDNIKQARNIELGLKKLKRKDYIENIVRDGFIKMKPQC